MPNIYDVRLELLRPGPAHNQFLSPLTPYIALCREEGPVSVHVPFKHRQLLSRLQRLRYATPRGTIPLQQREEEVREMGSSRKCRPLARSLGSRASGAAG